MAPNHPIDPSRNSQNNPRPTHPSLSPAAHPSWTRQNSESSGPCPNQPGSSDPPMQRNLGLHPNTPDQRYPSENPIGMGNSPQGGQPIQYPQSSQRTSMQEAPYPSAYDDYSRRPQSSGRASAKSDLPRIRMDQPESRRPSTNVANAGNFSAADGPNPHRRMQRAHSSTAPSRPHPYQTASSSSRYSAQDLSSDAHEINHMLSTFALGSPSISSSSSSESPPSPYFDRRAPIVFTMQMQQNSLEAVNDPEQRATLYTLMESSGEQHNLTADKNALSFPTHAVPPMSGHWSPSPMEDLVPDSNPSPSASSQSSASHSTSESESSPDISSLPNGAARRSSNFASTSSAGGTVRKNKMHQCKLCGKWFPRPSGLATHMNTHTGDKPFECPVPGCGKFFTVRSNARRHMKTHGVPSSPPDTHVPPPSFNVGFEAPYVAHTHDSGGVLPKLKWVETGPTTQMDMDVPDSPSGSDEVDDGPVPPSPLSAGYPPGPSFESQRNRDGTKPYPSKPR